MRRQCWTVVCALCVLCTFGFLEANAQEAHHKITAQEVAEALADPSATITYANLNFRAYKDVGYIPAGNPYGLPEQDLDETNHELRINGAGFLHGPANTTVLYRAFLPTYSINFPLSHSGVGDALVSAYAVPKGGGTLILGYGGAMMMPTATQDYFGTGKWSAGPTLIVAKKVPGKFTIGGLLTHMWSFAGDEDRGDVSMSTIQPMFSYFLNRKGTALALGSETTYNWEADDDEWTVPVTLGLSQILPPFGKFFLGVALAGSYYIEKSDSSQEWDMRGTVSIVLP